MRRTEPRIKAILFDLDLTLVDSFRAIIKALKHTLSSKGYSCKEEDVGSLVGRAPLEDQIRTLVPSLSDEEIWECVGDYRKFYRKHHLEDTTIYPQVIETLEYLKRQGFKLGIVTGKYRKPVWELLKHFQLDTIFETVVTAYEVKIHKPSPKIVFEAARRLGVKASECIVVGDSPSDIESGKRAGALTVALSRGESDQIEQEKTRPDLVIKDIGDLPNALHRIL